MKTMRTIVVSALLLTLFAAAGRCGCFPDVPDSHWAHGAIDRLTKLGLLTGSTDGHFYGKRPVSRSQMAVIVTRLLDYLEKEGLLLTPERLKSLQETVDYCRQVLRESHGADATYPDKRQRTTRRRPQSLVQRVEHVTYY